MSVVIETTLGDITVDLFINDRPRASLNFLKLCKIKYYNYNLFHTISRGFIAQTGDPSGSRSGGESIYGILDGSQKRYFEGENEPRIKHTKMGLISFVGNEDRMVGSQFFLTLGEDLTYLDEKHCVFGEIVEGFDILENINEVICDTDDRPYQDVRITHTVILDDPFPNPKKLVIPSRSPSPSAERLKGGRIAPDEEIDELEGKAPGEVAELQAEREAKARATILEMVGDLPDAEMAPPENVLFVCKLNPVTNDDDLEIIFSRFGKIKSCEVIRDKKTGDSLQYAFVEFEDKAACENAYFKMDNVLIDDRRIHVDFSQSVSKVKWRGKGRGVTHYDEKGKQSKYIDGNIGKGNYKHKKNYNSNKNNDTSKEIIERSRSPTGNKMYKNSSRYEREKSLSPKRNSSYSREYSRKSKYSNRPKSQSPSPSPERRHGYSKSPPSNKNKTSDREKYTSRTNRDKSDSPKRRKNDSPVRRKRESEERYSSSKNRKRSVSPKRRDRGNEPKPKKRSRSRSPKRHSQYYKSEKYSTSVATSRKLSPDRKSYKTKYATKGKKNSDSEDSDKSEKTEKYQKRTATSTSNIKYSPESKSSRRSVSRGKRTKDDDSDQENEQKKRKNKKKKSTYSSSEDSDSDKVKKSNKRKKVVEKDSSSDSSDSDYIKSKSKKKKSAKKSKHYKSSSDSDSYKKKSKRKNKHKSDSD